MSRVVVNKIENEYINTVLEEKIDVSHYSNTNNFICLFDILDKKDSYHLLMRGIIDFSSPKHQEMVEYIKDGSIEGKTKLIEQLISYVLEKKDNFVHPRLGLTFDDILVAFNFYDESKDPMYSKILFTITKL